METRLTLSIARTRAQVNTQFSFSRRPHLAESKPLRLICLGNARCSARTTVRREVSSQHFGAKQAGLPRPAILTTQHPRR